MKKLKYTGFYAPFDLLLDTRMGTLSLMNEEVAASVDLKEYRNRQNDKFPPFSIQEFKDAYAKRDLTTLQYSLPTAFMPILRNEMQRSSMTNGKEFTPEMPRLYVNTYPYQLTEELEKELGLIVVNLLRMENIEVELITKSLEELTPEYCREHFSFMAMYMEYNAWLDIHHKTMAGVTDHILLFAPAIYDGEVATEEQIRRTISEVGMHPLEMIEFNGKQFIDMVLIDIKHFSLMEFSGIKPTSADVGPIQPTSP